MSCRFCGGRTAPHRYYEWPACTRCFVRKLYGYSPLSRTYVAFHITRRRKYPFSETEDGDGCSFDNVVRAYEEDR